MEIGTKRNQEHCNTLVIRQYKNNYLNSEIMSATNDKIRGNWNVIKGKMKQMYGDLTDDDLIYVEGKEDELMGRIEKRTGKTKSDLQKFIDSL